MKRIQICIMFFLFSFLFQNLYCNDLQYSEIDIGDFLSENINVENDVLIDLMKGKRFLNASGQSISKTLPNKPRKRYGLLNYHTIDHNKFYIWFEKYDSTDNKFKCEIVKILHKENSNVFVKEIIPKNTSKEFIWGLYFYDKTTYLIEDKQYKPQYLVIFSYEDESLNIIENTEYYMVNSL